jgi:hypothetical protein
MAFHGNSPEERSRGNGVTYQELCFVLGLRFDMVNGVVGILVAVRLDLLWLVLEGVLGGKPAGDLKGCA